MAFSYKFHPAAAKDLYKLAKRNRPLGQAMVNIHIPRIVEAPFAVGRKKEGELSRVYGYGFSLQGAAYRILYIVEGEVVRFIAFGVHDVAYRKASHRV